MIFSARTFTPTNVVDGLFKDSLEAGNCEKKKAGDYVRFHFPCVTKMGAELEGALGLARTQADCDASQRDAPASWRASGQAAAQGGKTGECHWFRQFTWSSERSVSSAAPGGTAASAAATYSNDFYLNVLALEPRVEHALVTAGTAHSAAVSDGKRPLTFVYNTKLRYLSVSFGVRRYHKTVNTPGFWQRSR